MSQELPLRLIVVAARVALSRTTISSKDFCLTLHVSRATAVQLIAQLAAWDVISGENHNVPRRVLLHPRHEQLVVTAITEHGGIVPARNPLSVLAGPGMTFKMRRVLDLVAEGDGNIEIGAKLNIHKDTVKKQVADLRLALKARNRPHLVSVAYQLGLLPNPRQSGKDTR